MSAEASSTTSVMGFLGSLASPLTYQLIGTEGLIKYDREAGLFEVRHEDGTDILPWSHEKNFEAMYASWSRVLETGEIGLHSTATVVKDVVIVPSAFKEGTPLASLTAYRQTVAAAPSAL